MPKHIPKKRFGQNFLKDDYVINQIIGLINPKTNEHVIEIGPGLAALTKPLIDSGCNLEVVELDRDIVNSLVNQFGNKIIIHSGDALKFDYSFNNSPIRVVGNLPYNISTALLFHLTQFNNIIDMHFMLQKEVVERICASPNNGSYGRLSVMLQYRYQCSNLLSVSREAFNPIPQVESAIVKLKPLAITQKADNSQLNKIVTAAFSQRRKTIANSLKNIIPLAALETLNIDSKLRAENLSVSDFVNLANWANKLN